MNYTKSKIQKHPGTDTPYRFYDFHVQPSKEKPANIAGSILKEIAPDLQINPDLSQLKYDQVKESLTGSHILYQQQFCGKPVSGAWIRVDIDLDGKVFNIMSDIIPEKMLGPHYEPGTPKITVEKAMSQVRFEKICGKDSTIDFVASELVCFLLQGVSVLAWKLSLKVDSPHGEWKVYVDASTGKIVETINLLRYVNGEGKVFDPNPLATLDDITLRDDSVIPDNAYTVIVLNDLEETGLLDGKFVSTRITPGRVSKPDFKFLFTRDDKKSFKEVMAYYHIDSAQRYIRHLGFQNVMNRQIAVNVDGKMEDNSFYSVLDKSITFGKGGVDDAEDAEIIVHEYGHAILDSLVPGFGERNDQAKAIGEGFSDYLAASFFADRKALQFRNTFGNWNAASFTIMNNPPCMRRLDQMKKFPANFRGNAHSDGEIWSSCLWKTREHMGREQADRLIIQHLHLLTRNTTFETAANLLIETDQQLNMGVNAAMIKSIFKERRIL